MYGFKKRVRGLLMSSDVVIKVEDIGKCYQIYEKPSDRLKQFIFPRIQWLLGIKPKSYFRQFWALENISFEIRRGEAFGIIGRNGSGKSTLLQVICGTLNPSIGQVFTVGRIGSLLELGTGFNPEFTGRENVYLSASLLGLNRREIDHCFEEIVAFADIGSFIDQPVKTYSSGMLVRLAFAVQVQIKPDILIVDEALAVGDALFQKRCFSHIHELVANGTSLLFVSHEQEVIRTLTQRGLLLKEGRPIFLGPSSEVLLEYRRLMHEEEQNYLGSQVLRASQKAQEGSLKQLAHNENKHHEASEVSDKFSFGGLDANVTGVEIIGGNGISDTVFEPGSKIKVRIFCRANVNLNKLNISLRIRNKEGFKVYSWGTLNQDMARLHINPLDENNIFWHKKFSSGDEFFVDFDFECTLGANLYEIQAAINQEDTPNYLNQRILHWKDEAAFFQVSVKREEYFFGGLIDLKMLAHW
jgi:lipopolysaccharide transport system ATP-binding protein